MTVVKTVKLLLLGLVLAVAAWVYCGGAAGGGAARPAATRLVTDSAGRQVSVPVRPQRVVALNASNVDLFCAAGGALVGRPTTAALTAQVQEKVKNAADVGETPAPNLERIVALKPDLVLGTDAPFHHALAPVFEKAGIPLLLQALPTYRQVLETLTLYGELAGQPDAAREAVAGIESRVAEARRRCAGRPPVRTLVVWGSPESFNMSMPTSFAGDLLTLLGAENVAQGQARISPQPPYAPLSLEYVAKANPEVILLITHGSDVQVDGKFRKELAEHQAWQGLKAVKDGRVHKLPYHLFAVNPGTQVGEAVEHLALLLYPEVKRE